MTIIEQARALLAGCADVQSDRITVTVGARDLAALCRALIVRTEALQLIVESADTAGAWSDMDGEMKWVERNTAAFAAARRALADEPHTGHD